MLTNLRQETLAHVPLTQMTVMPLRSTVTTDWRRVLPVLLGCRLTLRELRMSDAAGAARAADERRSVARSFRRRRRRSTGSSDSSPGRSASALAGRYICFAVVPEGMDTAVGIFQVRQLEPTFGTAEWGFAIGQRVLGLRRLHRGARLRSSSRSSPSACIASKPAPPSRTAAATARSPRLVPCRKRLLRRSFLRGGKHQDQVLWSIVRDDWRQAKAVWGAAVHWRCTDGCR